MKVLILILSLSFSFSLHAQVNQDALKKTQDVIRDSSKRADHIKAISPQAQQAMKLLKQMGMTADQEASLFDIAADSMGNMLNANGGDIEKMQKLLTQGMSNPKAFLESMSSSSKSRLRELSSQVEGFNKNEKK